MLLIPSAWAYTIVMPCEPHLTSMAPDAQVPVDHAPAAVIEGHCDGSIVESVLSEGDQEIDVQEFVMDGPGLIELDIQLAPDTEYTWELEGTVVAFSTSDEAAILPTEPPVASGLDVWTHRGGTVVEVDVEVDGDAIWIVELVDDADQLWLSDGGTTGGVERLREDHDLEPGGDVCLTPHLRLEDGSRLAGAPVCDERPGCAASVTGLGASLLPALLGLALLRRRGIMAA